MIFQHVFTGYAPIPTMPPMIPPPGAPGAPGQTAIPRPPTLAPPPTVPGSPTTPTSNGTPLWFHQLCIKLIQQHHLLAVMKVSMPILSQPKEINDVVILMLIIFFLLLFPTQCYSNS